MASLRNFTKRAAASAVLWCALLPAQADTLVLNPSADGYIRASQTAVDTNNAGNILLLLGDTANAQDYLRLVLAFNLNHPALTGAAINSASLILTVNQRDISSGGSVDSLQTLQLRPLSGSFSESSVSWTNRNSSTAWNTPGGDFAPAIASADANPATVNPGDTITFTGDSLTNAIRNGVGGTYRLLVKLATEDNLRSIFRLGSGEGSGAFVPRLIIDYTPPPPSEPSGPLNPAVTAIPGHLESASSPRYALAAGAHPVEVKAERFGFDVAMFTLGSEPARVDINVLDSFTSYTLKPSRHGIAVTRTGNTLSFTLTAPLKLVLQIPGRTPLAIIATPPESDVPSPGDPGVLYFGPGVTVAGVIQPASNQTIYFAPGALVKGRIEARNVSNVKVKGRGILDTQGYSVNADRTYGILFEHATDIHVDGIGLRSDRTWWQTLFLNSRNVLVSDLNIFGIGVNTDGVDIDAVKDFVVRDTFIRAEDDGLGWHSLSAEDNGESITERVLADNIVIWNTSFGNGIRIGASMEGQLWRDITIRNVDILQHAGAGLYSDYSDWAWMRNLRFENITIERNTNPINFRILKTSYSNATGFLDERGHFDGLLFQNVVMNGGAITLQGFNATHRIDHVRFNGCTNAGVPLTSVSQLSVNSSVTDIAFNQPLPVRAFLPGIFEAEDIESSTNKKPQYVADDTVASGGARRVFLAAAPGDYVEHAIDLPAAGAYELKVRARRTPSSGRARLTVNGVAMGDELDFYAAAAANQEFDFGKVNVTSAGPQLLRLTVTGKNAASSGYALEADRFEMLSPLEAWRKQNFETTSATGISADTADPDNDGSANLLEFATGAAPTVPQAADLDFTVNPVTRRFGLSFPRLSPAPVTYAVEASGDLINWTAICTLPAGSDLWTNSALVEETVVSPGLRRVTVTEQHPGGLPATRFLRLRVKAE